MAQQPPSDLTKAQPPSSNASRALPPPTEGPLWKDLGTSQQKILKPLEREWPRIDGPRKKKWMEIASRFPQMSTSEQERVQARMREWARLSPQERNAARLNYRDAKSLPAQEKRDRWSAYQSLSEERKLELVKLAATQGRSREAQKRTTGANTPTSTKASPESLVTSSPSTPLVAIPHTARTVTPKTVAPTMLQARPGASTTLITRQPNPRWHQQPGQPKIIASPEFVNSNTLLPVVGPQGAATIAPSSPSQ